LTGALATSEGTAVVAGKDIHTSMQQIRQDMGKLRFQLALTISF
jgi:hypothetical protein